MTALDILAAAGAPTRLDPVKLFLDADIVVQLVMAGLVLASVWVWMIVVGFSLRMAGIRKRCDAYERDFWKAGNIDEFQAERGKGDIPSARVVAAGLAEWRRSTAGKVIDRDGTRQRLAGVMDSAVAQEADKLAERLNFLATVGSVAPFVGLFGTVWGIMNSFFQIGAQQNSSLAVVAPGISEALFATAIGLFAAIPAVIAYNRFSHRVDQLEARLQRFADRFHASLSRELEAV
ncbi:protein TolQ [Novosphingobium arvoryzae]|uniref:Tol-Pal system subunit TolQ n=1 Tax=Novosphingobium arvoryzae TaxID=1256514 RepID=A0A918VJS6_9SPHN|nr:protein TolQ [Novosphingobium arvoryzae]GHA03196.1 Tol-Pal system subunit TolQ [Novosphingobium arvoryzae]